MKDKITETLEQRGKDYGNFANQAKIIQRLKRVMRDTPNWNDLTDDKKEALDMTANKIGRILNGNPEIFDHWHDIAGYATLVQNTLKARPP